MLTDGVGEDGKPLGRPGGATPAARVRRLGLGVAVSGFRRTRLGVGVSGLDARSESSDPPSLRPPGPHSRLDACSELSDPAFRRLGLGVAVSELDACSELSDPANARPAKSLSMNARPAKSHSRLREVRQPMVVMFRRVHFAEG